MLDTFSSAPVILGYTPRSVFIPFHARRQRWACMITHRRAGKTVGCIRDMIDKAVRKPRGRFAFFRDIRLRVQSLDGPRHPSNPPPKSNRKADFSRYLRPRIPAPINLPVQEMFSSFGPNVSITRCLPISLWIAIIWAPPKGIASGGEKSVKVIGPRRRTSAIAISASAHHHQ
jgi:hypothetical protein